MFDLVSSKLKTLAKVLFAIGCVLGVIAFIVFQILAGKFSAMAGLFLGLSFGLGALFPLLSWVGAIFVYGFGELIEETLRTRIAVDNIEKKLDELSENDK